MELTGENRILVREGLKRLHSTTRIGLRALMEAVQIQPEDLKSYHIGFIIGPCFNAAGRLDTVTSALKLLMSQEKEEADRYAQALVQMNTERKQMTQDGVERAKEMVEHAPWKDDPVYLVYLEQCHESIAGIIAGRLREHYARPVLVFTDAAEEGYLKASGRSIEAYHMFEQLSACKDLFVRFGGHKMAAGLTMKKENLEELRIRLNRQCTLTAQDLCPLVMIDAAMPLGYITEHLVEQLNCLEPFGRSNEKPLFAQQHLLVLKLAVIGKNKNVIKMLVCGEDGIIMDALYFGDTQAFLSFLENEYGKEALSDAMRGMGGKMDLAATYYPQVNVFREQRSLQIVVQNYCRVEKKSV
jgi:single-stranded-DNA-specific exonuclease